MAEAERYYRYAEHQNIASAIRAVGYEGGGWIDFAVDTDAVSTRSFAGDLPRIEDMFVCAPYCSRCGGHGYVCETHPDRPWEGMVAITDGGCDCGAPGMPCRPELRGGDG